MPINPYFDSPNIENLQINKENPIRKDTGQRTYGRPPKKKAKQSKFNPIFSSNQEREGKLEFPESPLFEVKILKITKFKKILGITKSISSLIYCPY